MADIVRDDLIKQGLNSDDYGSLAPGPGDKGKLAIVPKESFLEIAAK
jgi:hypothetical protein